MSDGTHGHGATLAGGSAGTIGNITSITVGARTRDSIDISSMDSTNKKREFISGMADEGEISITVNYDGSASGVANALNTAYNSGTAETWTVTFPDTSSFACSGFITSLSIEDSYDDKITMNITIKLTGSATYTDVAA